LRPDHLTVASEVLRRDDTWRAATLRRAARVIPPLPPTLVLEGAAQPFLFEMVANQARHACRPDGAFMTRAAYNT